MRVGDLVKPTLAASPNWWDIGIVVAYIVDSGADHLDLVTVLWSDTSQTEQPIGSLEVINENR
jgi:hypothetical protein